MSRAPAAAGAAASASGAAAPASAASSLPEKDPDLKIILLGDSAVGKSKLVERFLMNEYKPRQMSTYALTVFRHKQKDDSGKDIDIDFWVRPNNTHAHQHEPKESDAKRDTKKTAQYDHLAPAIEPGRWAQPGGLAVVGWKRG